MKKLLLITFLFLITPDAKADMDSICLTDAREAKEYIYKNCERNNILRIERILERNLFSAIMFWCRHDREINYREIKNTSTYDLVCVLYDNKHRIPILSFSQ